MCTKLQHYKTCMVYFCIHLQYSQVCLMSPLLGGEPEIALMGSDIQKADLQKVLSPEFPLRSIQKLKRAISYVKFWILMLFMKPVDPILSCMTRQGTIK